MVRRSLLVAALLVPGSALSVWADGDGVEVRCITAACHASWNSKKTLHKPLEKPSCQLCHAADGPISDPPAADECVSTWKLTRPATELCTSCHPLALRNVVHTPLAEGKCTGCHDPHASDQVHLLKKDPAKDLCFSCHEHSRADYMHKDFPHEPVTSGACILCHDVHSSWEPQLLAKTGSELCLTCHEDIRAELDDKRHVHDAVLDDCTACHDVHGSDAHGMLKAPPRQLCLECHPKIERLIGTSQRMHGALDTEKSCLACHSPHASNLPRLLSRPLLDNCLSCHDKPVETPEGRVLANMAEVLRDNPDHHGPVVRADCSACHEPHASPNFRLLKDVYPAEFYLPQFDMEKYALCFRCHFRELVLVEKGDGITRFQHGDVNLHYSHVNREKSRTCRACHAVHASKNPAHLVETFSFGDWKDAPLGYEKLPTGGSCAPACHKPATYERGSKEPVPVVK